MKKVYLAVIGCLLSSATYATEINKYSDEFQQVEKECSLLASDFSKSDNSRDEFDLKNCLNWSLQLTIAENPMDKEDVVLAAMKVSEPRTAEIVGVAIAAGLEPAKVVAAATQIYPMLSADISKAAIQAGADPALVTEATAAGKAKK